MIRFETLYRTYNYQMITYTHSRERPRDTKSPRREMAKPVAAIFRAKLAYAMHVLSVCRTRRARALKACAQNVSQTHTYSQAIHVTRWGRICVDLLHLSRGMAPVAWARQLLTALAAAGIYIWRIMRPSRIHDRHWIVCGRRKHVLHWPSWYGEMSFLARMQFAVAPASQQCVAVFFQSNCMGKYQFNTVRMGFVSGLKCFCFCLVMPNFTSFRSKNALLKRYSFAF